MFQAIAAIIMFLVGSSKIIQAIIITISLIIGLTVIIIIAVIASLIKGNPQKEEEKTPKKEEATKIIYIVQSGTGNEIRIEGTNNDKLTERFNPTQEVIIEEFSAITEIPTTHENDKQNNGNDKLYKEISIIGWFIELIKYIIVSIVKLILIIIIVIMSLILLAIAIKLLTEYIRNRQGF